MGKRFSVINVFMTLLIVAGFIPISVQEADAVPSFARKYGTNCSACHSTWPMLNATGRSFKENGYRFPGVTDKDRAISDDLYVDKTFPVSAVLTARPYDEKRRNGTKMRAIHEAELMAAGILYKNVSGFLELEAEDENGFNVEIPTASLSYHYSGLFNLQFSYSDMLLADPYDTYSSRVLTRGKYSVIDQVFGGADGGGKLRSSRQVLSVYGRPVNNVFYTVGLSGIAGDAEGKNAKNLHARVAVDVLPNTMVGLFGVSGEWDDPDAGLTRDFRRLGLDFQADYNDFRFMGVFLSAEDDNSIGVKEENNAWYLQALYVVSRNSSPWIVPLIRVDSYEKNDGAAEYSELTLNSSYYFTQNIKAIAEFWTQVDVPDTVDKDNRLTVQISAAF
ncbi:MAG: hypothetical protein VST71_09330 [Nitrospirota bacterium]|nr:hypothetical protein [Nitrospirota bacterium]